MFKNGNRWSVGYTITDKGIKILKIYDQFDLEFKKILNE